MTNVPGPVLVTPNGPPAPSLRPPRLSVPGPPPALLATLKVALPVSVPTLVNVRLYGLVVASELVRLSVLAPIVSPPVKVAASEPLTSIVELPVTVTPFEYVWNAASERGPVVGWSTA